MLPERDEVAFQEARKRGLGGSDAAAIVGLDPYKSRLDLYREKIGETPTREPTPQMLRGKLLEPVIVDMYSKLTGRKVRRQPQRAHPDHDFLIGNIDRQILANGDERGTGLLEVKAPNMRMFLRYQREGLPAHIICQGQWYLGIYDYEWMDFAIMNADLWALRHFEIKRDDAFIASIFEEAVKFWTTYIVPRVEPPPIARVFTAPEGVELPAVDGAIITRDDPEWQEAAESLAQARTLRETAEAVEATAESRVKELMGVPGVVEGANLRAYWKTQPGRVTFDKKALAANKPLDGLLVASAIVKWVEKYLPPSQARELTAGALGTLFNIDLPECRLNLAAFDKVGKPFEVFRPYFLRPLGGEDDE